MVIYLSNLWSRWVISIITLTTSRAVISFRINYLRSRNAINALRSTAFGSLSTPDPHLRAEDASPESFAPTMALFVKHLKSGVTLRHGWVRYLLCKFDSSVLTSKCDAPGLSETERVTVTENASYATSRCVRRPVGMSSSVGPEDVAVRRATVATTFHGSGTLRNASSQVNEHLLKWLISPN